jgi:hypothetical protein
MECGVKTIYDWWPLPVSLVIAVIMTLMVIRVVPAGEHPYLLTCAITHEERDIVILMCIR